MKIIPQNDIVLCTIVSKAKRQVEKNGIAYEEDAVPLYKVCAFGPQVKMDLSIGDIVTTTSTGTKTMLDGIEYWMFKEESISGKAV